MKNFGELVREVRQEPTALEEGKKPNSMGPGWMLKADPKLGKAVKDNIDLAKKRQATYGDKSAGKSIKEENIEEGKRGLWDNIHAKRERIKSGSGERMRKPGSEGAPSEKDLKNSQTNEEVEQLDEMPGANMDTRAVHQHLKKQGWKLTRTSGSHDVFTHPEAKHHIPVPRHRQLKAPLVKGILKQASVNEGVEPEHKKILDRAKTSTPKIPKSEYDRKVEKYLKKKYTKEDVEQLEEISDKTLQSYRSKAHTQIQHYKYAGGKDKPEASAVLAKREPGMATATAKVIQKAKDRVAAQPKREPQKMSSYKPLGGRDDNSGRSYSESVVEEIGQTSNSNENPNAGRFSSGPAKKPMKPTPIVTAEQTASNLGEPKSEVPFAGPYVNKTTKVVKDKSGAVHTHMSRVKHLAKMAARKQAGLKEEEEKEDSYEKTNTPAKRSLSKNAGMVKDLAKNGKSPKKAAPETFQAEPELSSQIVKV